MKMNKIAAALVALSISASCAVAQNTDRGFFGRGQLVLEEEDGRMFSEKKIPNLPGGHGDNTNQSTPIGTGVLALSTLAGVYLFSNNKKIED